MKQKTYCSFSVFAKRFSCSSFVDHDETKSGFEGPTQPLLDTVVAPLASCWLCLCCSADAEFIALFFLLQLITTMGKWSQDKWINVRNAAVHNSFVCKSNNKVAFHCILHLLVVLLLRRFCLLQPGVSDTLVLVGTQLEKTA